MKRVYLPFDRESLEVELPDSAVVLPPNPMETLPHPTSSVGQALRFPGSGTSLAERLRAGQSATIVISDTRPVPNRTILPPITEELNSAGVRREDLTILNGTGLHRPNTPEELEWMPGSYDLILLLAGTRSLSDYRRALTRDGTLVLIGRPPGRWFGAVGNWLKALLLSRFVRQRLRQSCTRTQKLT